MTKERELAITTFQLLVNSCGAKFEDHGLAIDIIQELIINVSPKKKPSTRSKTSKVGFHNSIYSDIKNVRAKLMENDAHVKKYKGVDLQHYIDEVGIWYDKRGKLTTDRGWLAYIRQFMNDAIKEGKLVMKKLPEKRKADLTVNDLANKRKQVGGHINY